MKKRLQAIYWRGILITLLMVIAAVAMEVKLKIDDTRTHLTAMMEAAVQWTKDSNEDLQNMAESIAKISPAMRVTFLLDNGLVLADSQQNQGVAEEQEDHYNDQEIAAARQGKTGRQLRMSGSGAVYTLFMARRVSSQLILRLSYPVFEIARTVMLYSLLLLALFLVLYALQRRSIARFAGDQIRQFEDVRRLLDGEIERVEAVFPEFQPPLDAISYRVRRLKEDQEEILKTLNLRNDFVANASHELRSPLTSIRGFAEMLEEGLADTPEEQELCVQTIRSECDRMLAVIEDILRLSKAERQPAQKSDIRAAAPVAEEICQALQPQAAKKQIRLEVTGNVLVRAEEKDLWEILYNLTDNAIRYGRTGGMVQIRMQGPEPGRGTEREQDRGTEREPGRGTDLETMEPLYRIIVEDDGIGIAKEHIGHIFEQFYRVDEARNSGTGGTGLGLSIVRAIVHRLGGQISVESEPGRGTRFTVDFPDPDETGK